MPNSTSNPGRVIVNGANGKMGQLACTTIEQHPSFELVAGAGRQDDLASLIDATQADIVIDLTSAATVKNNSLTIVHHNARPVIGSSGLQPADIEELSQLCRQKGLGGLIAPNFSLGAVLMMHCAALAARLLPDAEIIEAHHPQKKDAPSGTAIKTAEMIAAARPRPPSEQTSEELISGARGGSCQQVPIHSLRLPGVVAQQSVIFGNTGETLTISHDSIDRQCFMPGIVFACEQVLQLDHLVYGLESLLLAELAR